MDVAPGTHRLQARLGRFESEAFAFTVADGADVWHPGWCMRCTGQASMSVYRWRRGPERLAVRMAVHRHLPVLLLDE
jgi:hypothetical protein